MNELRAGFSLDGYYKYDRNRLGVFMKENSGHKYFIYNLELKLEVVDEQFEVARISVKRAIERLPQHKIAFASSETLPFTNSTLCGRKSVSTRMLNESGELKMDSKKFRRSPSPSDSSGIITP